MKRTTFDFPIALQRGAEPMRVQVVRTLRTAMQTGRLAAGAALPASRALAEDLGVSRGVVVEAYEQLVAEGYLVGRRGSATRVAEARAPAKPPRPRQAVAAAPAPDRVRFNFRPAVPDLSLFPMRAWMRGLRQAWSRGAACLDYPDPCGIASARIELAAYLNRARATVAHPDHILVSTGFAQAARLAAEVLKAQGVRRIAIENPGQAEACADLRAAGVELVPVPVDAGGLCVEQLAGLDVGAVLVTPAHQFPTGAVLEPARRTALLAWAAQRRAFILEDDYDAEFRYDRAPVGALQGLAPEQVIYIGSASKILAPSLRLGWIVAPQALVAGLRRAKLSSDRGSPAMEQLALAEFLSAGELDRHLRRVRPIYQRRRAALVEALSRHLPGLHAQGAAAGMHLLVQLPAGCDEGAVVAAAASQGLWMAGASTYRVGGGGGPPALVLGYGDIADDAIEPGIRKLAGVLAGLHGGRDSLGVPLSG